MRSVMPSLVSQAAIATPLAAYSVRDRLGRDLFLLVQHGSYQRVPVEEQPLLDSGDVILYRGVHESDVFRFLQVDRHNLDQEKRDVWQKYIKTQEQMLSDSILSFNTIHDRTKRCETSHILDGTWISDEIAEANGLDIEGDGFAAELWQAAHQSFTLVSWMAENKFGPHFVKCRPPSSKTSGSGKWPNPI